MARVLLLDTNVAAGPILEALQRAGHEVHVAGANPADVLARSHTNYIPHDYADTAATLALFERGGFDALVPGCNDRSYQTCAEIADIRPLPGVDGAEATRTLNNKGAFRAWAAAAGLPVPRTLRPEEVQPGQAVIVKPEEGYSGRGASILRQPNPETLAEALRTAAAASRSGRSLVETFVEGQLFSHSAFIDAGELVCDVIVEEHGSAYPMAVDTSHVVEGFPEAVLGRLRGIALQIVTKLGLGPGLLHTQFILKGAEVQLIEITRRCPGDLYSLLIRLSTGLDYAAGYMRPFLGEAIGLKAANHPPAPILRHTVSSPVATPFGALRLRRRVRIERWAPLALSGEALAPSPYSRVGLLFMRAEDKADLQSLKEDALCRRLYDLLPADSW